MPGSKVYKKRTNAATGMARLRESDGLNGVVGLRCLKAHGPTQPYLQGPDLVLQRKGQEATMPAKIRSRWRYIHPTNKLNSLKRQPLTPHRTVQQPPQEQTQCQILPVTRAP